MATAERYIAALDLEPHIEGGYFKELYRSSCLVNRSNDVRPLSTTIYYLLKSGQVSKFHRLSSDELWFYHDGSPLTVHMIHADGHLTSTRLGLDSGRGETPQVFVPANVIFGVEVVDPDSFTLVSCMVSPGFDYRDFQMFDTAELTRMFPTHGAIIKRLNG